MSPETIDAMLAAGVTAEVLAAAWKAEIAKQEEAVQQRRARDADRQRRHRESRDVTVTNAPSQDTPSPFAPPKKDPTPQKITPPISPNPGELSAEPTIPPLTAKEVVEAWNERMAPQGFPAVKRLTGTRQRQLIARLRENDIDDWQKAFAAIERSPFLRGENDRGWRADFDFLLQPKSFTKLIEGAYDH